jgi:hypothetical protein
MANGPYEFISTFQTDPFEEQRLAAERQRRMAELLAQQSEQFGQYQTPRGPLGEVRYPVSQGLAQLATAIGGAFKRGRAEREEEALRERERAARGDFSNLLSGVLSPSYNPVDQTVSDTALPGEVPSAQDMSISQRLMAGLPGISEDARALAAPIIQQLGLSEAMSEQDLQRQLDLYRGEKQIDLQTDPGLAAVQKLSQLPRPYWMPQETWNLALLSGDPVKIVESVDRNLNHFIDTNVISADSAARLAIDAANLRTNIAQAITGEGGPAIQEILGGMPQFGFGGSSNNLSLWGIGPQPTPSAPPQYTPPSAPPAAVPQPQMPPAAPQRMPQANVPQTPPRPSSASQNMGAFDTAIPGERVPVSSVSEYVNNARAGLQYNLEIPLIENPAIPAQEKEQLLLARPEETTYRDTANSLVDEKIRAIDQLMANPARAEIFGVVASRLPNITQDSATAKNLFNRIVDITQVQGLMNMRRESPNGAAVGNVTQPEWPKVGAAIAGLSDSSSDWATVQNNLKAFRDLLVNTKNRINSAYFDVYGGRNSQNITNGNGSASMSDPLGLRPLLQTPRGF